MVKTVSGKKQSFKEYQAKQDTRYTVATENMNVSDKLKILEKMGREDLVDLFKDWTPHQVKRKKRGAPLDQRVAITVTNAERVSLDAEIKEIKRTGSNTNMSKFIRNRAMGNIDINGWKERAEKALKEIEEISKNQKEYRKRKLAIEIQLDSEEDNDEILMLNEELNNINTKLKLIVAQNEKRNNRLSGRMSMQEAETVKWRAQRLCLSSSDYLRMIIFGLEPASHADAHLSLDAKRRFYVSIIDVANNGWGNPPTIYGCNQCANYVEEITSLQEKESILMDRIKQLESFI